MSKVDFKPNRYFVDILVKSGFTRKEAHKIFNSLFTNIAETLLANNTSQIKGFGTFQLYSKANNREVLPANDSQAERFVKFYPTNSLKSFIGQIATNLAVQEKLPSLSKVNSEKNLPQIQQTEDLNEDKTIDEAFIEEKDTLGDVELTEEQRWVEFDLHYNVGIAYKEMMLYEMAVEELLVAIGLIENHLSSKEQKSKLVQSCEIISLCYVGLSAYEKAENWLLRGLELLDYEANEYKALRYDLALLYEATGRIEEATEAFFDVYAIDINFRRVAQKLKTLQSRYIKKYRDERRDQLIPVLVRGRSISGERFEEDTLIVNVSRRGAAIKSSYPLQPNTFLELHFPNVVAVKIAKIVWCTAASNSVGGFQAGILVYHEKPK